jgi:hypothetical protein
MTSLLDQTKRRHAPQRLADPRQAAILVLRRIELREIERRNQSRDRPMTRAQFTVPMLKRLWNRPILPAEFVGEVAQWLALAGWCFFNAGKTYAAVRMSAVENWPRLGTGKMAKELDQVEQSNFPFDDHEHLLIDRAAEAGEADENEGSDSADDE